MDTDSESDEESQINEINQLKSVLEADQPASLSASQYSSIASTSGVSIENQTDYSKLQKALALNKLAEEKLLRLEKVLVNRLKECRERLKKVDGLTLETEHDRKFRYLFCGKPYFKDRNCFAAPDNEDTILMAKANMFDFTSVAGVRSWTVKDKSAFIFIITEMSVQLRKNELQSKIAQLQRDKKTMEQDSKQYLQIEKNILMLKKEMESISHKPLAEIALPLDQEYDWEAICIKSNYRHTVSEYRALWKLFLHPSINKNTWTKAEHSKLVEIANKKNFQNWESIAHDLCTGRTGYQCFVYFRTDGNNKFSGQKWSKEEEEYLKRLIDYYREENFIPWNKIAALMDDRTKIQIYNKYIRSLEIRKGRFLPEEDTVLLTCYKNFGSRFKQIAKYLPGRSVAQLQLRYKVLMNNTRTSIVWTVEEDKKLIQVMANQDKTTEFSSVTKYFPGRSRSHLRARYNTVMKWMKMNPLGKIEDCPRRGARRLNHGQATQDLNTAVQILKTKIEKEIETKKKNKVTKESSEDVIDHAIIATLITEQKKVFPSPTTTETTEISEEINSSSSNVATNVTSLRKMLILLRAKLDKEKFIASSYTEQYPGLIREDVDNDVILKVKSYSRKQTVVDKGNENKPNIWNGKVLQTFNYTLPPNYATITGCRRLLAYVANQPKPNVNVNTLCKRNTIFKDNLNLMATRFKLLFLWPILLSNEKPNPGRVNPLPKQIKKRTKLGGSHSIAIPIVKGFDDKKQTQGIDLHTSPLKSEVAITNVHVGNSDYMFLD